MIFNNKIFKLCSLFAISSLSFNFEIFADEKFNLQFENKEIQKPTQLPGEPSEPSPGSWGYNSVTGVFIHPKMTPDSEGPQPFVGSLSYLDSNQYINNMKVEGYLPYVAGHGHSWQAVLNWQGSRYLYDYETTMFNLFDITDSNNIKFIKRKDFKIKEGEHQFGPMTIKYNKNLAKTIAVQCYEVPRYGILSNKYINKDQIRAIRERKMLRGFRIYEVTDSDWSNWKLLSETPLDVNAKASDQPQQGSGCQDVPVYDGEKYLFVAGAPDDSYSNTEYKSYLYSGAQLAYDVSNPEKPKLLSIWSVPGQKSSEEKEYSKNQHAGNKTTWMGARMPLFIPKNVEEGGKYGYAAMGGFGFYIVDISNPSKMKTISHLDFPLNVSGTVGDNIDVSKVETTGMVYYSGYPLAEDCHEPYKDIYAIDVRDPKKPKIAFTLPRPMPAKSALFTDYCQRRGSFGPKRSGYVSINTGKPNQRYLPYAFYNAGVQIFDLKDKNNVKISAYFVPKMAGEFLGSDGKTKVSSDPSNPVHSILVEWDRNLIWAFSNHGIYVLSSPLLGEPKNKILARNLN
ncbi:hypothetical protein [Fluviispira multicolorata]|uniref:LVIVD repeat-containing protein n=1 Tax=Fluviispira multicolorata TaxID=2654512 RepID=A0A833JAF1_9BACT|nr:hypothetical protein [Fluviispira multicolorata]KAB8027771.1 hypothetical protein GCL57_14285 [Fluviispira multicolorata]